MEEKRSNHPSLGVSPYDYSEGLAGYAKLLDETRLALNQLTDGPFKKVLARAIHHMEEYSVNLRPAEEYKKDKALKALNDAQIEQVIAEDLKRQTRDAAQLPDARRAANLAIHNLLGEVAKQKMMEDEEYQCNLRAEDPKPSVAMRAIERVIVTQRGGDHPASILAEHNKVKREILNPMQRKNESEWDYFLREDRLVTMAERMGIDVVPGLYKDEKERAIAFAFGLDSRYRAWHMEIRNRVSKVPTTRKGVVQVARERGDKGLPETKKPDAVKPDAVFLTTTKERNLPHRLPFLKREEWINLTPEEKQWRRDYNEAIIKQAAILKEEMAKKKEGYKAKLLRKDAAMVTAEQEEQEFVLLVTEGDGIRDNAQKAESAEEGKKRKRDITPPRKAGYDHEEELMGNREPSHKNVNHHMRHIQKMYPMAVNPEGVPIDGFKKMREQHVNKLFQVLGLGIKHGKFIDSKPVKSNDCYLHVSLCDEKNIVVRETEEIKVREDSEVERERSGNSNVRPVREGETPGEQNNKHDLLTEQSCKLQEDNDHKHHSNRELQDDYSNMAKPSSVDKEDNSNVCDPEDYDEGEFDDMPSLIDCSDSEDDESWNQQTEDNGDQVVVLNSTLDTDNSLFNDNLVVFDNASGINICRNIEFASDIQKGPVKYLSGINPTGKEKRNSYDENCVMIDKCLGRAAYMPHATANIISQAVAEDLDVKITHQPDVRTYTLTCQNGKCYIFGRVGNSKHYLMDMRTNRPPGSTDIVLLQGTNDYNGPSTIKQNELKYTKKQVDKAKIALTVINAIGTPPMTQCVAIVNSMHHPPVNADDIRRAFNIYGKPLQSVRGNTTRRSQRGAEYEHVEVKIGPQMMEADLMFIGHEIPVLVAILSPIEYSLVVPLKDKSIDEISRGIEAILSVCQSKDVTVTWIRSDGEPALNSHQMVSRLHDKHIQLDVVGAGSHAPKVERRIRFIKEKLRTILHSLPYRLNLVLTQWAIKAANRFTNMQVSTTSMDKISPRDKFMGRPLDYRLDVYLPFGTFVQCTKPQTNNTMQSRTDSCIMLGPKEPNLTGTFYFYNIHTKKIILRNHAKAVPIPDALIDHLNASADRDHLSINDATRNTEQERQQHQNQHSDNDTVGGGNEREEDQEGWNESREVQPYDNTSADILQRIERSYIEDDEKAIADLYYDPNSNAIVERREGHKMPNGPGYFDGLDETEGTMALVTAQNMDWVWAIVEKKQPAKTPSEAEEMELRQLIEKGTFEPLSASEMSYEQRNKAVRSILFTTTKTLPNGEFDKVKSRLVGRGDMQDKDIYKDDLSANTADRASIMTIAAIAAQEGRRVASVDIGGAYLNAMMPDDYPTITMRVEKRVADLMNKINSDYGADRGTRGEAYVKVKRALYGFIESAKLWQGHLTDTLSTLGFFMNPYDPCVFNMGKGDNQCTIVFHVDDLMITCRDVDILNETIERLDEIYKDTKCTQGEIIPFLGLDFDFSEKGSVRITGDGIVESLIDQSEDKDQQKKTTSPYNHDLHRVDEESPLLNEDESKYFHSMTAKLLYIARMIRLEVGVGAAFLTTRVTKATAEDKDKLHKIIRYLSQSHTEGHKGFRITPGTNFQAEAYIDAAYGVNPDAKSQTGCSMGIGGKGFVYNKSSKQHIVTKSSTEAELVALSDMANQAIHQRNFLEAQGYQKLPAKLYQDNQSTITLVNKGRSTSLSTRHINIRYFWLKERIESGEIEVIYKPTEEMGPANIATKATVGNLFRLERQALCNWD